MVFFEAQKPEIFLKNFALFTGKHLCWILFFNQRLQHRCFTVNIAKILRTPMFVKMLS